MEGIIIIIIIMAQYVQGYNYIYFLKWYISITTFSVCSK